MRRVPVRGGVAGLGCAQLRPAGNVAADRSAALTVSTEYSIGLTLVHSVPNFAAACEWRGGGQCIVQRGGLYHRSKIISPPSLIHPAQFRASALAQRSVPKLNLVRSHFGPWDEWFRAQISPFDDQPPTFESSANALGRQR
jgi:hypothetical protein